MTSQDNSRKNKAYPEVTIPNTESIRFVSSAAGRTYKILVSLPPEYDKPDSDQRFGVAYVLDADLIFGMVADFARLESLGKEMTSLIVMGIGYYGDPLHERVIDMAEHADLFLQFIADELIPFVDSRYRTQTKPVDRTFVGHSLGGQFVLHTLFHRQDTFTGYSATSPVLKGVLAQENEYFAQHAELPVRLFMAANTQEASGVEAVFKCIADRHYKGLEASYRTIPNLPHGACLFPAITYGLHAIYSD